MTSGRLTRLCGIAATIAASIGVPADAMNVSPMAVELTTTGAHATARIQVLNVNPQALPFEVRIYRIDFDSHGTMTETPADADFVVFPPQGLIAHNQRQVVRLQWVGGHLDSSRGYYAAINQVPVPLDPSKIDKTKRSIDVQVVYHMKVLATVAPPGATPKVAVESVRPIMIAPRDATSNGKVAAVAVPGIAAIVTNSGKRYAMLAGTTWTIEGRGIDSKPLKLVLTSARMSELLGAGYVPALTGRRTFEIPTGVQFAASPISVKFSN